MGKNVFELFSNDLLSFASSALMLIAYHAFLRYKLKRDPAYTIHGVNALVRSAWVENIMNSGNRDIMAVQTLRNAIMGPLSSLRRRRCSSSER